MNKTAIKNFAISARKKLMGMAMDKAGIIGITKENVAQPASRGADFAVFHTHFGTETRLNSAQLHQRENLVRHIREKGYDSVMEEVAYTWFNRLIAVRFMEVNDYLPSRVRVLSSETAGKAEPDLVTLAPNVELGFTPAEMEEIYALKDDPRKSGELFKKLFIKQCNALGEILPELFEQTADYTELLLDLSWDKEDNVVRELLTIDEADFLEAVEIIGWMYQYYNTEPKQNVFDGLKKNIKITKENIPAATQLFTPDWIVRYMVENSLGRLWIEGHQSEALKGQWKYYLDEAAQEPEVEAQLAAIRENYKNLNPEDIKLIDPCMGSGHILVYAFTVLMQIYVSCGYAERDAASLILEKNLYGLDIDKRAYQLSYFALIMKARGYDRRLFGRGVAPQVYCPMGYPDGEEYGSLLLVDELEPKPDPQLGQMSLEDLHYEEKLNAWNFRRLLAQKYDVVVTNPPYMGSSGMSAKLADFVKKNYPDTKADMFACFIEKGFKMANATGFISMITMESWMFLSSFEKMRQAIVEHKTIVNMVHMPYLGKGGTSLGINFGTAAVVFQNQKVFNYAAQYDYVCYYETDDDGVPFMFPVINERYKTATTENFSKIPGSPIAYWVSEAIQEIFQKNRKIDDIANPRQGLATGNNDNYLRFWAEVVFSEFKFDCSNLQEFFLTKAKYVPYNKGGAFRKWYGNIENIIRFDKANYEALQTVGNHLPSKEFYFKESITWSKVTSGGFSMRYVPNGSVFDVAGCSIFSDSGLNYLLGLANSIVMQYLMNVLSQTLNYEVGSVKSIPIIFTKDLTDVVERIVEQSIDFSKFDWDSYETSWDFKRHPLV